MIQSEVTAVMMSNLFWLTDEQTELLEPLFPTSHGKPHVYSLCVCVERYNR